MRLYILLILIVLSYLEVLNGQSYPMPINMPVHTKIFWGENGLFRKLNIAPKSRSSELKLRVEMLQLHQKIALATLGLFSYQSFLGNQMINGDYSNDSKHSMLSKYVWSMYMSSAALSYLAPPAMKYNKKYDSITLHRMLSWTHFCGMALIPYLGYTITTSDDYDRAVKIHQTVAISTLGSMFLSAILSFLP
tara:strand:- start:1536 stop:2111 length:576 start_codon:yes stop_codon:yes gene_type:complete